MANKIKSIRIVSVLVCVLVISLALVLYGTLSQLQDSKTATGTVTFNLADYDLVLHTSTGGVLAAPGQVGKTNIVQLINTYATGTDGNTGTTAGMGPLYIKMVITGITVGSEDLEFSSTSNTIVDNSNFTIALNTDADLGSTNESLTWTAKSDGIYLTKVGGGAPLPFSESRTDYTNAADIQFNITMKNPTNVNNGFNAPTANDGIDNNKYQGQEVTINYTLYWTTSLNKDGSFPTIQNNN